MTDDRIIIKSEAGRLKAVANNERGLVLIMQDWEFGYPAKVTIDLAGATLDYKALFAIWCRSMAKSFTERGRATSEQDMHDILAHKFLGYTQERTIGKTVIRPALRTITYPEDLTRPEFYNLMRRIEMWAYDVGVPLPAKDSEYENDKQKQDD